MEKKNIYSFIHSLEMAALGPEERIFLELLEPYPREHHLVRTLFLLEKCRVHIVVINRRTGRQYSYLPHDPDGRKLTFHVK